MNLNSRVLLLNNSFEPIAIVNVKKAIIMYFLKKVDVVLKTNYFIRSAYLEIKIPDIIKLKKYIYIKHKKIPLTRKNILSRDNNTCQYCGKKIMDLTIDHIIPKQRGGTDIWSNLVVACKNCNTMKGNFLLKDLNMRLIRKPYEPSNLLYLQNIGKTHKSWHQYLYLTN